MAGSPKKRARKIAAKSFLETKGAIEKICGRITSGPGTLVDICRELGDLHYGTVNEWIQADEDRRKQYKLALDVRAEHAWEHVFRELVNLVQADFTEAYEYRCSTCGVKIVQVGSDWKHEVNGVRTNVICEGAGQNMIFRELHAMPANLRRLIVSMEVDELFEGSGKNRIQVGVTRKLKFAAKERGYELLARHLGKLVEKVEHGGKVTLEEILEASKDS